MSTMPPVRTHQISHLNQSVDARSTIKARVINKELISLIDGDPILRLGLTDESGEIQAIVPNVANYHLFSGLIEVGKVYYFSNFFIRPSFGNVNSEANKYEMVFTLITRVVMECPEDLTVSNVRFNFPRQKKDAKIDPFDKIFFFSGRVVHRPSGKLQKISHLKHQQEGWVIKARVTNKSEERTYGCGLIRFNMTLTDDTGDIFATAFNLECYKFYNLMKLGKVYLISHCELKKKPADNSFCTHISECDMIFNHNTRVECRVERYTNIPHVVFSFVPLRFLDMVERNTIVDIIGVCLRAGELKDFESTKYNRRLWKLEIFLVDPSLNKGSAVRVILWGEQAKKFDKKLSSDSSEDLVVAIKGARCDGIKEVSLRMASMMQVNPDIEMTNELMAWFKGPAGY